MITGDRREPDETVVSSNPSHAVLLRDHAPAKVNLTLGIRGKRPDGYHDLASLIVFADIGDTLTFEAAHDGAFSLETEGGFAEAIDGGNLVLRAAELVQATFSLPFGGRFALDKRLPVAAGLGGGSSDAAAAVRLLLRAAETSQHLGNQDPAGPELAKVLARLGADVPVCLAARAAWVRGVGERVAPISGLPELPAVLVNPGVMLPTGQVFAALNAPAVTSGPADSADGPGRFEDLPSVAAYLRAHPNDLQAPAQALAPVIGEVIDELGVLEGCRIARLSGSGPTCFGLFATRDEAEQAAATLSARHPRWWVAATRLH